MPVASPSVHSGSLDRYLVRLSAGTITAWVIYTLSNAFQNEIAHQDIPLADVQAIATAAGRSTVTAADVCTWIQQNVPEMADTPVTAATPPAPPAPPPS